MSMHIQHDNKSQEFEAHKGKDLSWTLYDGTHSYGFFPTREAAGRAWTEAILEAQEEVNRCQLQLEEAEDVLGDLVSENV